MHLTIPCIKVKTVDKWFHTHYLSKHSFWISVYYSEKCHLEEPVFDTFFGRIKSGSEAGGYLRSRFHREVLKIMCKTDLNLSLRCD